MDVTQSTEMTALEEKNFGPGYSSQDPLSSTISQGAPSLTLYDFAGLFLIIGSVTIFSLFFSKTPVGQKICATVMHLLSKWFCFKTSEVNPDSSSVDGDSAPCDGDEIHESIQNGASVPPPGDVVDGAEPVSERNEDHDVDEIVQTVQCHMGIVKELFSLLILIHHSHIYTSMYS